MSALSSPSSIIRAVGAEALGRLAQAVNDPLVREHCTMIDRPPARSQEGSSDFRGGGLRCDQICILNV